MKRKNSNSEITKDIAKGLKGSTYNSETEDDSKYERDGEDVKDEYKRSITRFEKNFAFPYFLVLEEMDFVEKILKRMIRFSDKLFFLEKAGVKIR